MKNLKIFYFLFLVTSLLLTTACDDDESLADLGVTAITATGTDILTGSAVTKDLNGASASEDVPTDATITITFDMDVDVATVDNSNVKLSSPDGDVNLDISSSGSNVIANPTNELERGTNYTLEIRSGLTGINGELFTDASRTFKTAGNSSVEPPQASNQVAYWNLDGNSNPVVGSKTGTDVSVEYVEDRFGFQESAAKFDGNTSIIEFANGAEFLGKNVTISFWINLDTTDHLNANGNGNAGHFIMGVGAFYGFQVETDGSGNSLKVAGRYLKSDGTTGANDMFVNADGKNRDNGGWIGVETEATIDGGLKTVLPGNWNHIIFTYNGDDNKRTVYLNGQLLERDDLTMPDGTKDFVSLTFDPAGSGETIGDGLALGFPFDQSTTLWATTDFGNYNSPTANHFKGLLDDVRFFDAAYSDADAMDLYNAEKN